MSPHRVAACANRCVRWPGNSGQLPATRNAAASAQICPRGTVGRVFKGCAPDFRTGAATHPSQGRAIKGQALGGGSAVVEPANVIAALPAQRGEEGPDELIPVR